MAKVTVKMEMRYSWFWPVVWTGLVAFSWAVAPFLSDDEIDTMAERMAHFIVNHCVSFSVS